jgi:hypothetical protein
MILLTANLFITLTFACDIEIELLFTKFSDLKEEVTTIKSHPMNMNFGTWKIFKMIKITPFAS